MGTNKQKPMWTSTKHLADVSVGGVCTEPWSCFRLWTIPPSASCFIPQLSFPGSILWHFSWLQSLLPNNTTTYSVLDWTCSPDLDLPRARPTLPLLQVLDFLLPYPVLLTPYSLQTQMCQWTLPWRGALQERIFQGPIQAVIVTWNRMVQVAEVKKVYLEPKYMRRG